MSFFDKLFKKEPKPEPYKVDTEFGEFTMEYWDKEKTKPCYAYLGFAEWTDESGTYDIDNVEIECDSEGSFEMKNGLAMLRKIMSEQEFWLERARQGAADGCLTEDGTVLTCIFDEIVKEIELPPEEFKKLLHVVSIDIFSDGGICLTLNGNYNGKSLFTDHCISVSLNGKGEVEGCNM